MDKYQLSNDPTVIRLTEIQSSLGLNDTDFCRRVKFDLSPSSWGKIKKATFSGNCDNALASCQKALDTITNNPTKAYQIINGTVILDHVQAACDAVELARVSEDEHKLVLIVGYPGSGKTKTGRHLENTYGGTRINAQPSWTRSYLHTLKEFAAGLGIGGNWRSAGQAESDILRQLALSPRLIIIDEANHFSRDALNFLKSILNQTDCCIVMMTLPNNLAKMASDHREEMPQLLRRSNAIIHIPTVSGEEVNALAQLYSDIDVTQCSTQITGLANNFHRLDTVRRVLTEMSFGSTPQQAITQVKKDLTAVIR